MEGIINLLKPAGMTSHDGVYLLRRLSGLKKIGHTGTLDPMAAGVLPLCVGSATRIMDYLDPDEKEYRCEMQLGLTTDTWDIWGTVIEDQRAPFPQTNDSCGNRRRPRQEISPGEIEKALGSFRGEIYQMPPMYSSVRVKGKHLYEYARENKPVEVKERPVIIYDIRLIDYQPDAGRVLFDVTCSKGTYIRSICREAGEALGCGAAMSFLVRKRTGAFSLENAVTAEELASDWSRYLLPADFPLQGLGKLAIPEKRRPWFQNGGSLRADEVEIQKEPSLKTVPAHISTREGLERAYTVYCGGEFLGIMLYDHVNRIFAADKVFSR